jgi:hypothetical protein
MRRVVTPLVLSLLAAFWGHASVPLPPGPDPRALILLQAEACHNSPSMQQNRASWTCQTLASNSAFAPGADKLDLCATGLLMSEIWRKLGQEPSSLIVDLDPWKHPYRLECLGGDIAAASAGVDGVFDTEDDIRVGVPDLHPMHHHHLGPSPGER